MSDRLIVASVSQKTILYWEWQESFLHQNRATSGEREWSGSQRAGKRWCTDDSKESLGRASTSVSPATHPSRSVKMSNVNNYVLQCLFIKTKPEILTPCEVCPHYQVLSLISPRKPSGLFVLAPWSPTKDITKAAAGSSPMCYRSVTREWQHCIKSIQNPKTVNTTAEVTIFPI